MTAPAYKNSILPHENDILDGLDKGGYFKAIDNAKLSKKKFIESLINIQEEERKKLGHELHDSVNSSLTIAKFYLTLLPAGTEEQKFAKTQLSSIITSAEQSIRSISCNLVISQESETCIADLINTLVKRVSGLGLFKLNCKINNSRQLNSLSNCQKIVIYRIVQEQLNNIIKYSKATEVSIHLQCTDKKSKGILLKIEDNGAGFDTAAISSGIGLSNISNRAKQFNGHAHISSSPGKGCKIEVKMQMLEE